jgi:hypothetical protein
MHFFACHAPTSCDLNKPACEPAKNGPGFSYQDKNPSCQEARGKNFVSREHQSRCSRSGNCARNSQETQMSTYYRPIPDISFGKEWLVRDFSASGKCPQNTECRAQRSRHLPETSVRMPPLVILGSAVRFHRALCSTSLPSGLHWSSAARPRGVCTKG